MVYRENSSMNIYHIVSRGVSRQVIFMDFRDFYYFCGVLDRKREQGLEILAWCLMDNHVHLLLAGDINEIAKLVKGLFGGYARHFNKTYGRTGPLFESRFKSEAINDKEYLLSTVRYIHQNPVKANVGSLDSYPWSSYNEFLCENPSKAQLKIIKMFGGREGFVDAHRHLVKREYLKDESRNKRLSDAEAIEIAKGLLGENLTERTLLIHRSSRRKVFQRMLDQGLTFSQISRITGFSIQMILATVRNSFE